MGQASIRKAFYLCSTTREFLTDDIPQKCNCTASINPDSPEGGTELKHNLSRVVKFIAERTIVKDRNGIDKIIYPECGMKE